MSSEKRRKARVQGGWAAAPKSKASEPVPRASTCQTVSSSQSNAAPAWLGKTVDCPQKPEKFTYQEPNEEILFKKEPKVIDKSGVYDISMTENGVSRIRLFNNFIGPVECREVYSSLFAELQWRQREETRRKEGSSITYLQPRMTAWFGDEDYTYGSVTNLANKKWHPTIEMIRERLEQNTGYSFNSCLCNLYRDGHDSVDWHADDEPSLGINPVIASLSFGDLRVFELKRKVTKNSKEEGDVHRLPLNNGSLLIMEGATQEDWLHRVPKEYHDRDPRINLTYRVTHKLNNLPNTALS